MKFRNEMVAAFAMILIVGFSTSSQAEMPDCLSGVCEGDIFTEGKLKDKGFALGFKNPCLTTSSYQKEFDNIRVLLTVSDSENAGQAIGEVIRIQRIIKITPQDQKNFWQNRKQEIDPILSAIQTKYGKPKREFGNRLDNVKYRFNEPKPSTAFSGRDVSIYIPSAKSDHIGFVVVEVIENRLYSDYHVGRSSACTVFDDGEEEAKKIIPD